MGKRGADRQLTNQDDPNVIEADARDDDGAIGPPLIADATTLSQRKIVQGRRKFGGAGDAGGAAPEGAKKKIGMFSGLKLKSNMASPDASASAVKDRPAFGTSVSFGTSFGMGASSGSSTIRSTAPKVATPSFGGGFKTPAPKPPAESGSYQSAATLSTTKVPTKAASASFSKSAVFGKVDKSRSPAWAGGAAAQDGNATVSNDFAALNASFLSTITAQAAGKGKDVVDLTPCCNEYIAFAENIRATSRPVPSAVGVGARSPVQGSADTTMAVDTDAASAEADDEDGDALYTIPKVRVLYLKHFDKTKRDDEAGKEVYFQHKLKEAKDSGTDEAKWTPRGVGKLIITEIDGKRALAVRSQESSDKMYLVNMLLSNINPSKQGKKNVLFVALPNPPHGEKCPVCEAKYADMMRSNQCVNGCSGPTGYHLTTDSPANPDNVPADGTKEDPQPYSIKVSSSDVADALIAKINELKQ